MPSTFGRIPFKKSKKQILAGGNQQLFSLFEAPYCPLSKFNARFIANILYFVSRDNVISLENRHACILNGFHLMVTMFIKFGPCAHTIYVISNQRQYTLVGT